MLKPFRNKLLSRVVTILLAVHIFNVCIDPPDADPCEPEDLSVNEIESIAEFILEDVMQIDNAISEHDEDDNSEGYSFDLKKELAYHDFPTVLFCTQYTHVPFTPVLRTIEYNSITLDISSPPPKV